MRRLLIAAYKPIYFEAFAASTGNAISQSSVRAMLDHLEATYGTVHAPEVAKEMAKLQASFSPAEPIEKYWATIKRVIAFAAKHRTAPPDTTVIEEINGLSRSRPNTVRRHLTPQSSRKLTGYRVRGQTPYGAT
jgi:hypothetical protein